MKRISFVCSTNPLSFWGLHAGRLIWSLSIRVLWQTVLLHAFVRVFDLHLSWNLEVSVRLRSSLSWRVMQGSLVGNYRRFGIIHRSSLQGSSSRETSIITFQLTLRNIPEERRPHLHGSGGLELSKKKGSLSVRRAVVWGSRGIALFILNLDARWRRVVSFMPILLYPPRK